MKAIIVHGGAGDAKKQSEIPERVEICKQSVVEGFEILRNGGSAIDAVVKSVKILEDNPLFDAGRGSYLNEAGEVEMDSGMMDGSTLNIGAISAVKRIKNPIELARLVMEKSNHNFLTSEGAERFGEEFGIEFAPSYYFLTERITKIWEGIYGDTVGAVALDDSNRIAAGVSTGGTPNKLRGRVGDSPIVGSGFYSNNLFGAVATGIGEDIMKVVLSFRIMLYLNNEGIENAVKHAISDLSQVNGKAGLIAIDDNGNIAFYYNTQGMFRAYIKEGMSGPVSNF